MSGSSVISREQWAAWVARASDAELEAFTLTGRRWDVSLELAFAGQCDAFDPEVAGPLRAVLEWRIAEGDADRARRWQLVIEDGRCLAILDGERQPDVVYRIGAVDFLRFLAADVAGLELYASGRLKVEGDPVLAARANNFFGPSQFAAWIARASETELEAYTRRRWDFTLPLIFASLCDAFVPEAAGPLQAVLEWRIAEGDDRARRWQLVIEHGRCSAAPGGDRRPDVVYRIGAADFLSLMTANVSAPQLYTFGRIKVEGDLMLAARGNNFFRPPPPPDAVSRP